MAITGRLLANIVWLAVASVLLLTTRPLLAQPLSVASPESAGMSSTALAQATANLQQHIDAGDIAGVVAAVARRGQLVYFENLGRLDIERDIAMPANALFRIYSMGRELTSFAVLQLYEQGKFEFDDPVQEYLPQFAGQRVLIDASGTDISQTRERVGDITIAHLLTHTSGLGSRSSRLYRENNVRARDITLDQMVDNAARVPLFQDPGTQFRYGIHATILGKLVELWSGQPLQDYMQEHVFEPLGMDSTMFWAQGADAARLATVYRPTEGRLQPYQIEAVPFTERPRLIEGGVGYLSSVPDFLRFSQLVMNRGELDGVRLLGEQSAALIYENAVPAAAMPIGNSGYWAGSGWTLGGFNLVLDNSAYSFPVSNGTIWWDGSAGTRYFIDPQQELIIVIMAQVSPSRGGGFREDFSRDVYSAIID